MCGRKEYGSSVLPRLCFTHPEQNEKKKKKINCAGNWIGLRGRARAGSRPSDTWQLGPKQIVFRLPQTHCIDRKPMPDSRPDTEVDWRGEVSRPFGVRKSL